MKKVFKLTAMLIVISCFATASYADTLASYPIEGTGYLNSANHVTNEYIAVPATIQGKISLVMDNPLLGQICWQMDVTIEGMEPMTFEMKNHDTGECYTPMITEELIHIQAGQCWGGGCPEDESKPGLVGSSNFNAFLKLSDFTGLISINGSNHSSPEETENPVAMDYSFIGNVALDLAQEEQ